MREILFRGKRVDNGEWIYGYYFYDDFYQKGYITFGRYTQILKPITNFSDRSLQVYAFEVNPETVGQYTGLTDKNNRKIFEGDIVQEDDVIHNGEIQIKGKVGSISLEKSCFVVLYNDTWDFLQTNAKVVLVIGNIHDNPELLEVTE